MVQALINIGVAIFFNAFAELFLNDYMNRVTSDSNLLVHIQSWFRFYRGFMKWVLVFSMGYCFSRCARFSNCGGVALYVVNTTLSVLINMAYTVFPTRRS